MGLQDLPIAKHRDQIIERFKRHDTLIVTGETGSGKSTQVPKYIYSDYIRPLFPGKLIAIAQPRRVAAVSLARRVAEELDGKVGELVGYAVRFDEAMSAVTRIKYVTDGMLLRESLSDKSLLRYSAVILDEAHERTLRTDILFGMLKRLQEQRRSSRSPLKIVIMSATMNPERFVKFFSDPFVLNIPGRQFPVKICYTIQPQQDYLDAAVVTIFQLHQNASKSGDILVFLTGQEEIDTVARILEEYGPGCARLAPKMIITPIYAALSSTQQMAVFRRTPDGCRKIVLATNIAETSITIPGIRFVVDTGFAKMRTFNARVGIETLSVVPISKASCRQRAGRAGREAPGECYRLFTEEAFRALDEETVPEVLRTNLANVFLTMKASGVEDVLAFDYLEKPPLDSMAKGLDELLALGALDQRGRLTSIGALMAACPLNPDLARVLIESDRLGCTEEALSIISMLSVDNVFLAAPDAREQIAATRKNMFHMSGDHLTLLNMFNSYMASSKDSDRWCRDNCIDPKSMGLVAEIRSQLLSFCEATGLKSNNSCGSDYPLVLKAFCCGFHTQVALLQPDKSYKTILGHQQAHIHPSSVLHTLKKPELVLFNEVILTTKCYLRTVSSVESDWVLNYIPQIN